MQEMPLVGERCRAQRKSGVVESRPGRSFGYCLSGMAIPKVRRHETYHNLNQHKVTTWKASKGYIHRKTKQELLQIDAECPHDPAGVQGKILEVLSRCLSSFSYFKPIQ